MSKHSRINESKPPTLHTGGSDPSLTPRFSRVSLVRTDALDRAHPSPRPSPLEGRGRPPKPTAWKNHLWPCIERACDTFPLSPQRGEGRGEGCARPTTSARAEQVLNGVNQAQRRPSTSLSVSGRQELRAKTVETVRVRWPSAHTPLKRGVNGNSPALVQLGQPLSAPWSSNSAFRISHSAL